MIDKTIYVEDLVEEFPQSVSYLQDRDIICIECGAPVWGTLEENLVRHNIEDIDGFMAEFNAWMEMQSKA